MSFRCFLLLIAAAVAATAQDHTLGYDNTPFLPGTQWRVHDVKRPHPPVVTPGAQNSMPPSDAIVLFNGKDLSQWVTYLHGQQTTPKWKVQDGYVEVVDHTGGINTKEKFGDVQLHIEWASPSEISGASQSRGNSGVLFMGRYEIQVLDSYQNPTYADGQAAAIYGQYPPLVNASRKPGEWQTYDIVFEAPRFDGEKLTRPAYATVFHNGVLVQNHEQLFGDTPHAKLGTYKPHSAEESLQLQNHHCAVRYRNIWIRRLKPRP
jgi:3-keto-disaccharide hydrolase